MNLYYCTLSVYSFRKEKKVISADTNKPASWSYNHASDKLYFLDGNANTMALT